MGQGAASVLSLSASDPPSRSLLAMQEIVQLLAILAGLGYLELLDFFCFWLMNHVVCVKQAVPAVTASSQLLHFLGIVSITQNKQKKSSLAE